MSPSRRAAVLDALRVRRAPTTWRALTVSQYAACVPTRRSVRTLGGGGGAAVAPTTARDAAVADAPSSRGGARLSVAFGARIGTPASVAIMVYALPAPGSYYAAARAARTLYITARALPQRCHYACLPRLFYAPCTVRMVPVAPLTYLSQAPAVTNFAHGLRISVLTLLYPSAFSACLHFFAHLHSSLPFRCTNSICARALIISLYLYSTASSTAALILYCTVMLVYFHGFAIWHRHFHVLDPDFNTSCYDCANAV